MNFINKVLLILLILSSTTLFLVLIVDVNNEDLNNKTIKSKEPTSKLPKVYQQTNFMINPSNLNLEDNFSTSIYVEIKNPINKSIEVFNKKNLSTNKNKKIYYSIKPFNNESSKFQIKIPNIKLKPYETKAYKFNISSNNSIKKGNYFLIFNLEIESKKYEQITVLNIK